MTVPFHTSTVNKQGDGSYVVRVIHHINGESTDVVFPHTAHSPTLANEYSDFKNAQGIEAVARANAFGIPVQTPSKAPVTPAPTVVNAPPSVSTPAPVATAPSPVAPIEEPTVDPPTTVAVAPPVAPTAPIVAQKPVVATTAPIKEPVVAEKPVAKEPTQE